VTAHSVMAVIPASSPTVWQTLEGFARAASPRLSKEGIEGGGTGQTEGIPGQAHAPVPVLEETVTMIRDHFDEMLPVLLLYPQEFPSVSREQAANA
jgi:hypothetical protein